MAHKIFQPLEGNHAKARCSTGSRIPEGKDASEANARKHGFSAFDFSVPVLDGFDDIQRLRAGLIELYQPVNSQELFALERIAVAQHQLRRAARLESGLFAACMHHGSKPERAGRLTPRLREVEMTREQKRNLALAEGFFELNATSQIWNFFLRYQSQNELLYRRALEDFDRLRALRPKSAAPLPSPASPQQRSAQTPSSPVKKTTLYN